jgi:hypothetical protein
MKKHFKGNTCNEWETKNTMEDNEKHFLIGQSKENELESRKSFGEWLLVTLVAIHKKIIAGHDLCCVVILTTS